MGAAANDRKKETTAKHPLAQHGATGGIMAIIVSLAAWGQAEIILPRILQETRRQTEAMIKDHSHSETMLRDDFKLWVVERDRSLDRITEQIIDRLKSIEESLRRGD